VDTVHGGGDQSAQKDVQGMEKPKQRIGHTTRHLKLNKQRHDDNARDGTERGKGRVCFKLMGNL
jgi:hypothetical protein